MSVLKVSHKFSIDEDAGELVFSLESWSKMLSQFALEKI